MSARESQPISTIPSPRFYLLEYFYVLLKSFEKYSGKEQAFSVFKGLKEQYRLGESKYRVREQGKKRFEETFANVIDEASELGLITVRSDKGITLKEIGRSLVEVYEKNGIQVFNRQLFELMERKHEVFRVLIEFAYRANKFKPGLLVFPIYSPLQLGFEKSSIETTKRVIDYSQILVNKLQNDIREHLAIEVDFSARALKIVSNLQEDGLLGLQLDAKFDPKRYNAIVKRFRDYWISVFLKEVYNFESSWSSFERWVYRAKQIGIIQATEFYPNFNGKVVYATSVVAPQSSSHDFEPLFEYPDRMKLYVHHPSWNDVQNRFVESMVESYFELRHVYRFRGPFISLHALREFVCYKLKISEVVFQDFLNAAYKLNLAGQLPIKISLEVDKLPEETKVMYLTREPVVIDGKYRNIILIEVTKEDRS